MAKQVKVVEIRGTSYQLTQLGGETSAEVMERFGLGAATGKLHPSDMKWLRGIMAEHTKVGVVDAKGVASPTGEHKVTWIKFSDMPGGFDEHFRGKPMHIVEWLKAAVEATFGPFFDVLREIGQAQKDLFGSSSPPESDGSSGESAPAQDST